MAWIRAVQGDTFGWRWDDPARGVYGEHFVSGGVPVVQGMDQSGKS